MEETQREAIREALAKAEIETSIAEQEILEWKREQAAFRAGPNSVRGKRIAQLRASPLLKLDLEKAYISPLADTTDFALHSNTSFFASEHRAVQTEHNELFQKELESQRQALEEEKQKLLETLEKKIATAKEKVKRAEHAKIEALKAEILAGNRREDELKLALSQAKTVESQLRKQLDSLRPSYANPYTDAHFVTFDRDQEMTQLRDRLTELGLELEAERRRREETEAEYREIALELNGERMRNAGLQDVSSLSALETTVEKLTMDNESLMALHKSDQEVIRRLKDRVDISERTTARSRSPIPTYRTQANVGAALEEMKGQYEKKCEKLQREVESWRDKAALLVSRYRRKVGRLREDWRDLKEDYRDYKKTVERELERRLPATQERSKSSRSLRRPY